MRGISISSCLFSTSLDCCFYAGNSSKKPKDARASRRHRMKIGSRTQTCGLVATRRNPRTFLRHFIIYRAWYSRAYLIVDKVYSLYTIQPPLSGCNDIDTACMAQEIGRLRQTALVWYVACLYQRLKCSALVAVPYSVLQVNLGCCSLQVDGSQYAVDVGESTTSTGELQGTWRPL